MSLVGRSLKSGNGGAFALPAGLLQASKRTDPWTLQKGNGKGSGDTRENGDNLERAKRREMLIIRRSLYGKEEE